MAELLARLKASQDLVARTTDSIGQHGSWPHRSGRGSVMVSRDPSKPKQWRVTSFDREGLPTGHIEAPTKAHAVKTAHSVGAAFNKEDE